MTHPTGQSSSSIGSSCLATGRDSPVRKASSHSKLLQWPSMIRPSAGMISPFLTRTMSPGTTSSTGITLVWGPALSPLRRTTVAWGAPTDSSEATVLIKSARDCHSKSRGPMREREKFTFSACHSVYPPTETFKITKAAMTPPEIQSIVPRETAIAATVRVRQPRKFSIDARGEIRGRFVLTQDDRHGVTDLSQEDRPDRWPPGRLESVGTVDVDPFGDVRVGQTLHRVDIERFQDFGGGSGVGVEWEGSVDSGAVGVGSLNAALLSGSSTAVAVGSFLLLGGHGGRDECLSTLATCVGCPEQGGEMIYTSVMENPLV